MQNQITQLNEVHSFLEEMRSTTSNNQKIEILKKHSSNEFLAKVFFYTYNPFYKYNVHQRTILKRSDLIAPINIWLHLQPN